MNSRLTYYLRIDRDVKTKKTFWYTTSESWKGIRNEVPDSFKKDFAEKQITCGWSYHFYTNFLILFIFSS